MTLNTAFNKKVNAALKNLKQAFDFIDAKTILLAITFNYCLQSSAKNSVKSSALNNS